MKFVESKRCKFTIKFINARQSIWIFGTAPIMSLKKLCREEVIKNVFLHGHSSQYWRTLIICGRTSQILTKLFRNSEVLSFEILAIQQLEEPERASYPENPALYFVDLNKQAIETILKDYKNKKYKKFTVIAINESDEKIIKKLDKYTEPDIILKFISMNFVCYDEHAFSCSLYNIHHVARILQIKFNTFCIDKDRKQKFISIDNELQKITKNKRHGDLVFYERINDMSTPLIRFYTFQALLQDSQIIHDNILEDNKMDLETSELWNKIKDLHIAEVNSVLSLEASKINSQVKQLNEAQAKDLVSIVLQAPEQMQLKEEVATFLNLLDRCFELFEKHNLKSYATLQQNIATKKTETGSNYTSISQDCNSAFGRKEYVLEDKFRLWMLAQCNGHDFSESETKELIKCGFISKSDKNLSAKIKLLRKSNITLKQPESQYAISRYRPLLYHCLYNFIHNKKGLDFTQISYGRSEYVPSLRKTTFIFKTNDSASKRRSIIVYIDGGCTFSEISEIRYFNHKFGIDCYLGSDAIISIDQFVDYIQNYQ